MADLIRIGRFARLTGLSPKTLRRYDELGLLTPTIIDLATGYRYYSREQEFLARGIQQLRALELPLADIRTLLMAPDATTARAILAGHRAHLATRIAQQQRALTDLRELERWYELPGQEGTSATTNPPLSQRTLVTTLRRHAMKLTLARAITSHAGGCLVQRLDDSSVLDAPLAQRMLELGTRIRPGMIVALDREATPPTIRWRFETRPVEALAENRLTILGQERPYVDARPAGERANPLHVGDTVTIRFRHAGEEIEVYDTVVDGRPLHPEFLEADFPRIAAAYHGTTNA